MYGTADEGYFYRIYGDIFPRHIVFYKVYANERFLLDKKHFSKAMASSVSETLLNLAAVPRCSVEKIT